LIPSLVAAAIPACGEDSGGSSAGGDDAKLEQANTQATHRWTGLRAKFPAPKTQINFQGMLQGNWDGSGSVSGSWTGPDLSCGGRWTFQGSNTYAPKCP
jgi:hypothetical protein